MQPVIDRVLPLRDALAAQECTASNTQVGKIVLTGVTMNELKEKLLGLPVS